MSKIFNALLIVTPLFGFSQIPSYIPQNGLVGWWPFNGNADDESGNGHDGTGFGVTLDTDRFGQSNKAYSFDGNDYIQCPGGGIPQNVLSVSAWFRQYSSFGDIEFICLGEGAGTKWGTILALGGNLHLAYGRGCQGQVGTIANNQLSGTDWHHVVYTSDGESGLTDIYIDGIFHSTHTNNSSSGCPVINLYFGVDIFSVPEYINGVLDDIGIWNRKLTESEISSIYNSSVSNAPCLSSVSPTISGLSSSYTLSSNAAALVGAPSNGLFFGPGMVDTTFIPSVAGVGTHTIMYTIVDQNGCISTVGQCVEVTLDIGIGSGAQIGNDDGVEIQPNPGSGLFTLMLRDMNGPVNIDVTDVRGRVVHTLRTVANGKLLMQPVDLTEYSSGVYTVSVQVSGLTRTLKLVKE